MKLGLLVSFSRRLTLELGTFSKIPTAHTRYFQGPVTFNPRPPRTMLRSKMFLDDNVYCHLRTHAQCVKSSMDIPTGNICQFPRALVSGW